MPMTYTDDLVQQRLAGAGLDTTGTSAERRERLAVHVEEKYRDHLEAWEIRTGRPWNTMARDEAETMVRLRPSMMRNPGVLSRLLRGGGLAQ